MPEQIYIGNVGHGQVTSREPFVIDNDAFPQLFNAYSWRGRVLRKRGTEYLGQLERQIDPVASPTSPWQFAALTLTGGVGNLLTGPWTEGPSATPITLELSSSIAPGSINVVVAGNTYKDTIPPSANLLKNNVLDLTSFINYATGDITIGSGGSSLTGTFGYFPGLPVMGLRDYVTLSTNANFASTQYPLLLAFDTKFSYQTNQSGSTADFFSTSFYKYTGNPVVWSGADYQQFWTTNYQGALWATNNKPGFHFMALKNVMGVSVTQVSATQVSLTIATPSGLVANDVIWINEVTGTIGTGAGGISNQNINGQTGYVVSITPAAGTDTIVVNFDGTQGSTLANFQGGATGAGGIAQYLTNSIAGQDGIKWYDGDPTNGTGIPVPSGSPSLVQNGWVNFAPPLTALNVSINDKPLGKYYLVGALAIVAFKDRLLFFSPYIQTSGGIGTRIQLQDTVIWSWNGTPYYSSLTPINETSDVRAYYVDQTGLGGWLSAGIAQPIATVSNNEDVLLVGFGGRGRKTRFVYSGNDLQPFLFFNINSELPSSATFSAVVLDKGAIDIGQYGIAMTDQQSSQRVDLDIPDSVFDIQNLNNGVQRVNAIRDFFKEWIYFAYPLNDSPWRFPTRSFLFNYRDNTWAVFYENFTTHGNYRSQTKKSWLTTGFKSWDTWNEPWNTGSTSPLFTAVIAGNPQGYVLKKDQGTGEGASGTIQAVAASANITQITSIDHCVSVGDYLYFTGALGLTGLNGNIGRVIFTVSANVFVVDILTPTGSYLGLGQFTRLSQPLIQTKMFAPYWDQGRQCRLAVQKYLMDKTDNGQVTVNIYLSQDSATIWNNPTLINVGPNNSLVYSQLMYTCQESTNLGLTPANTNLQMPTAKTQQQIWHRFNTSMIGDSVQIGITLSDSQMRNIDYAQEEIGLHGIHLTAEKGPHLA